MKKLFTMLVASVCCSMAFAATATKTISVPNVTILKGGTTQLEVTVSNAASNTAFQFDLTLPKGVSVKKATIGNIESNKAAAANQTRQLKHRLYDANANKYRFLSYDNQNTALADDKVIITLEATANAEACETNIVGSDILVVNGGGTPTPQANGDVASISVVDGVEINISACGATTFVTDADLDFTNSKMTAYIVTGNEDNGLWLASIKKVPAKTPIYVKAPADETAVEGYAGGKYIVNKTTLAKTYFKNFLIGNNSDNAVSITPDGSNKYYFVSGTNGAFTPFTSTRPIGAHKAYVKVAPVPAAKAGADWKLKIGDPKQTTLCADVDLDFSNQSDLKAFTAIGYEDGSVWLASVKYASAGTPLYLKGPKGEYTIKSKAAQVNYTNMLVGNNTDAEITIGQIDGEYSNYYVGSNDGFTPVTSSRQSGKHKSYLQILTTYVTSAATRGVGENAVLGMQFPEVFMMAIEGDEGDATGISRVAPEAAVGNDAWYNLSGQRISTPTKKGLYIRNGKKVIVK